MHSNTKHVVRISTNEPSHCDHCNFQIDSHTFAKAINHYINEHGYSVMHVGTETTMTSRDEPFHTTVAVLGK